MWVFLTRRLRMWLLATVALPALAWTLDRVGRRLEQRHGETRVSRLLRDSGRRLSRRRDGRRALRDSRSDAIQAAGRPTR